MNVEMTKDLMVSRMRRRGLDDTVIDFFLGAIDGIGSEPRSRSWDEIRPVSCQDVLAVPKQGTPEHQALHTLGLAKLGQLLVVKLNGGRATSMGGTSPKCMVEAKDGKSFLEIVLQQVMADNTRYGVEMALLLMNSFFTGSVTERILARTPLMIFNVIQNEFPRITEDKLLPLDTGTDEDWCPGGHGDFFFSINRSGMVDELLQLGLRYAFISNIDNLSAVATPALLGKMISEERDFMMEVIQKTAADKKGGSPIYHNNRLSLLEVAEVSEPHQAEFQDIDKFRYFNTNNLWVDLRALKDMMEQNRLHVPVIRNRKTILGENILQIETAIGAAISSFERPGLVEVSRDRFSPVKTVDDLDELRSGRYRLTADFRIASASSREAGQ